ncbi:OLC1v1028357C1 [Oldenlandia corymbosa var. corymbosa]|uniref:OLC1v1028357C1 n=1 Tax=Oldenlandia corymbosa var. corymbosa TaxID=529605 RepID=A0AAV1CBS8_OLDCO|nr:OLC1v1028357C1 [Oldenlandia corymbosa var. corymbosa]
MAVNHISFSRVILPIMVLLFAVNGKSALAAVNSPFCAPAQPGNQQNSCNAAVNGAPTWKAALTNIMNAAKKDLAPVSAVIAKLPNEEYRSNCNDSLTDLNDCINEILGSIEGGDLVTIDESTQRIYGTLSTCSDSLEGKGVDLSEIQKFKIIAADYAALSMAILCSQDKMYCSIDDLIR